MHNHAPHSVSAQRDIAGNTSPNLGYNLESDGHALATLRVRVLDAMLNLASACEKMYVEINVPGVAYAKQLTHACSKDALSWDILVEFPITDAWLPSNTDLGTHPASLQAPSKSKTKSSLCSLGHTLMRKTRNRNILNNRASRSIYRSAATGLQVARGRPPRPIRRKHMNDDAVALAHDWPSTDKCAITSIEFVVWGEKDTERLYVGEAAVSVTEWGPCEEDGVWNARESITVSLTGEGNKPCGSLRVKIGMLPVPAAPPVQSVYDALCDVADVEETLSLRQAPASMAVGMIEEPEEFIDDGLTSDCADVSDVSSEWSSCSSAAQADDALMGNEKRAVSDDNMPKDDAHKTQVSFQRTLPLVSDKEADSDSQLLPGATGDGTRRPTPTLVRSTDTEESFAPQRHRRLLVRRRRALRHVSDATSDPDGNDESRRWRLLPRTRNNPKARAMESNPPRRRTSLEHDFAFGASFGRNVIAIVLCEVVSARGLPRWRNLTHTSFDMDPFAVLSFSHKVFRTRVCRHTLDPVWREKLMFHVHADEAQYSLRCAVYDWDNMSANDYVGEVRVDMETLIHAAPQPDENGLYAVGAEGDQTMLEFDLPLMREHGDETAKFGSHQPTVQLRCMFRPYAALRQRFWREMLLLYDTNDTGTLDAEELQTMLLGLGSTLTPATLAGFFAQFGKDMQSDELTVNEAVRVLEMELQRPWAERRAASETDADSDAPPDETDEETTVRGASENNKARNSCVHDAQSAERVVRLRSCPLCRLSYRSRADERDIITHLALCASRDWRSVGDVLMPSFVTASQARRKWYTNVFTVLSQGGYHVGANSANILVRDRRTGQLLEEKMQVHVRLGIRLLYQGAENRMNGVRARRMLRSLSVRQGAKYDAPSSVRAIMPFVAFHELKLDEMVDPISSFNSFNAFFSRRIRMELRPIADPDDARTLVSCADCRLMAFASVIRATQLWIKGRQFSVHKLLGGGSPSAHEDVAGPEFGLVIFRLAPQDYHRFHAPVDGVVGAPKRIEGEYYTVNPMAIRSAIDVYGENTRVIIPLHTELFGTVYVVAIGAMMVGSVLLSVTEGQRIARGDELGYFQFGGSTLVLLVESKAVRLDADLLANSDACIETLVQVGMRIGRATEAVYT